VIIEHEEEVQANMITRAQRLREETEVTNREEEKNRMKSKEIMNRKMIGTNKVMMSQV